MPKAGFKEEITDIMSDKVYTQKVNGSFVFYKGKVLKFAQATIKITRIDRVNKRVWGEHIEMVANDTVYGHYGHNVDTTGEALEEYGKPYCTDCEVVITEPATKEGEAKFLHRRDNTLADGTEIEDGE